MILALPRMEMELYDQLRDMARGFSRDVIRPQAGKLDEEEAYPKEIFRQMGELGLFGITVPEEMGGSGFDTFAYAIVMEELAKGYASVADQCGLVEMVSTLLVRHGTEAQRAAYLSGIIANELCVAYCLTEAEAGSDLAAIKSTATRTASGWTLNGSKLWINNAPMADLGFVLARTDPSAGHRGMSVFLVDLHSPGITRGPHEHKMGQRGSQVGSLYFDDVEIPEESLLGELNRGFHMMMSILDKGRVGIGALSVGIAQAGLEAALEYAQQRKQFGKTLAANQGLQWMLADMAKDISAARGLVHRAALLLDNGLPARAACSMAKCFASDVAVQQTANAAQVFGGSGYIRGFEVERLYRDAKVTQIYEGTNQIQRTIIARDLLDVGPRE